MRMLGALLMFSTAAAYGLDMSGAPPEPTSSVSDSSPQHAATVGGTTQSVAQFRGNLMAAGIDPDSGQGKVLMRWLAKFSSDPAWKAALAQRAGDQQKFWSAPLSADDRLRMLQLLKDMAMDSQKDCHLPSMAGSDFIGFAKTASPRIIEDVMEILEISINSGKSQHPQDQYSVTDLLDADAQLNATPPVAPGTHGYPPGACGILAFSVDAITGLPEPVRQRASFEFIRMMSGQKAAFETVLDNPSAYLDDAFDERQLPETLRRHLPADGSRPLPYSRLIFEADWVNKKTPADKVAFNNVFINRRNNGVIADVANADRWSAFTLSYGIAVLRTQVVVKGTDLTQRSTIEDEAAMPAADHELVPGQSLELAVPQPSQKGVKSRRCEIGQAVPASTIFPSLTGTAIGLRCTDTKTRGKNESWHSVWLTDYNIAWTQSIDDEDGRTEVVIRNVTIEGAPQ
ncbi:hypothetical protein [Telmatospirillum sp.]|uniref:hypothetical protein n=1 Tax=Telmatospirillum sp. TaxID=2079197 RepID=UPI00284611BE|nr:hypothetical protein [Telmatospirillum sp.]MDR3438120.1 hypothetical protein [Telmatospirillum sp.]